MTEPTPPTPETPAPESAPKAPMAPTVAPSACPETTADQVACQAELQRYKQLYHGLLLETRIMKLLTPYQFHEGAQEDVVAYFKQLSQFVPPSPQKPDGDFSCVIKTRDKEGQEQIQVLPLEQAIPQVVGQKRYWLKPSGNTGAGQSASQTLGGQRIVTPDQVRQMNSLQYQQFVKDFQEGKVLYQEL